MSTDDKDTDIQEELQSILLPSGDDGESSRQRKPRFFCAGVRRVDELSGKKACHYQAFHKWYGYCPSCQRPYACLRLPTKEKNAATRVTLGAATMAAVKDMIYYSTGIPELDKVLGGGVVEAKTLLLGAEKGSGKTTMLLQACDGFAQEGRKAYFASGEMTRDACILYAKRLGITNKNIALFGDPEGVDVENLFEDVLSFGAKFLVLDSMQVSTVSDVKGDIGKVSMMEAVTQMVTSFAQAKEVAIIMIGHLQKAGDYGGSEQIQHLVDGLLRMERKYAGADDNGKPIDTMIRELGWEGKTRQGRSDVTARVEMTDDGIRPVSVRALRMLAKYVTEN